MYAILSHGGRQYRVSAGDRLVVDRLEAEVGSVVALEPILLTGGDGHTGLGKDLDGMTVAVTVIAHTRGRKLRIFKYKAKKRSRKMAGYRSDLTELRVESILAKGAALPKATTARPRPAAAPVIDTAAVATDDVPPAEPTAQVAPAVEAVEVATPASRPRRRTAKAKAAETAGSAAMGTDGEPAAAKTPRATPKRRRTTAAGPESTDGS